MTTLQFIFVSTLFLFISIIKINGQSSSLAVAYVVEAEEFKQNQLTDSAIIFYEKAAIEFQIIGNTENYVDCYNQIGIILTRQDKYEKAKSYLDKALSTGLSSLDSNNLVIATTYISLGVIYNAEEKYVQSLTYHFKALSIRLQQLGEWNAQVATSYGNIGNVYRNNKEFEKSIDAHLKAMQIRQKLFGDSSVQIIDSYVGLGNSYREKKEYTTSLDYFEKALRNKIIQRGEGHKDLAKYYKNISDVYFLMKNKEQGDFYKNKSEEVTKS